MLGVYLVGPMAECTPEQAGGWRDLVEAALEEHGFLVASPVRNKGILTKGERMGLKYEKYGDVPELRAQSIYTRDHFDVAHSDILFANMRELGIARRADGSEVLIPSIGSDFELAGGLAQRKPVVLIAPPGNPYQEHPFIEGAANVVRFDEVAEGIAWLVRNFAIYTFASDFCKGCRWCRA